MENQAEMSEAGVARVARPAFVSTTLIAGAWALVPTMLLLVAAVGFNQWSCRSDATDCSWGFEYFAAALLAVPFWLVAAPVVVWRKQKRAQNPRALLTAVVACVFMFVAVALMGLVVQVPLVGVVFALGSPFGAVALAQVVLGRRGPVADDGSF